MTEMPNIMEALLEVARDHNHQDPSRPDHEVQIAELRALFDDYAAGPARFKVGDFVTPKKSSNIKDAGEPHIVVETREAEPDFTQSDRVVPGCNVFGARWELRIADYSGTEAVCHWVECWQIEPFKAQP